MHNVQSLFNAHLLAKTGEKCKAEQRKFVWAFFFSFPFFL